MAYDKVVDSAQLDADLKVVADAIRTKGGTTEQLSFPQGMKQAVDAIQSGGGSGSARGVVWTEVDEEGYPIKVDASTVKVTSNLFRYGDYARTKEIKLPSNTHISTYYMCYNNSELEKINLPTECIYYAYNKESYNGYYLENNCFYGCKSLTLEDWQIPEGISSITINVFESAESLTDRIIPQSITKIESKAFNRCYAMTKVIFLGTPTTIANNAFGNCTNITDIYVPWSEGEVAGSPWGATNSTIHYNTVYDENHNPIV